MIHTALPVQGFDRDMTFQFGVQFTGALCSTPLPAPVTVCWPGLSLLPDITSPSVWNKIKTEYRSSATKLVVLILSIKEIKAFIKMNRGRP